MASPGSTYFITKYKLARDGVAALEAPPCSHHEASYEGLMSTPYRSAIATKGAKIDLKRLAKVNDKEVKRVEELLEKRREDSEKGKRKMEENGANDEQAVASRVNIILRVPNSTLSPTTSTEAGPSTSTCPRANPQFAAPGPLQAGPSRPPRRQRVTLNYRDSILTHPPAPRDNPSPATQPAPAKLQNPNKRKGEGLFDLEPAAKRQHLGHCRPVPDHVAAKPFRADDYNYKTPASTSVPKSQRTTTPEIPTEQATTRRMAAKGARLHAPEGDNFSRDGGLKRNLPTCGPISSAKKSEVKSDLDAINARKKEEEMYQPLRDELKALARRYGCEETPDRVYWQEKAQMEEKKTLEAMKRNEGEVKKAFDDGLAFHRQNRAHEKYLEELIANFSEKYEAVLEEQATKGSTPALTALIYAADEASKKLQEFKSWLENWKEEEQSKLAEVQDPANGTFDPQLEFQRRNSIHRQHLKELAADLSQKVTALCHERDRKGYGRNLDALIAEADAAWEKAKEFQVWYMTWKIEFPALLAKLQVQAKIEGARARSPNSYKRDLRHDHCKKYRVARKCAGLAKRNVEAKEKLNAMAREIDTINKRVGADVNGYQLSGIPVHIRMMDNSKKSHREMWTGLNDAFRVHWPAMKPSRLRYELGACLEGKSRAVVAKAAREAAEEGLRRRQAADLKDRKRRTREMLEEYRRRERARTQVKQYRKHRAFPDLKDERERMYFKKAFDEWVQHKEQRMEQEGESSEDLECHEGYESSQDEMDGMESYDDEDEDQEAMDGVKKED